MPSAAGSAYCEAVVSVDGAITDVIDWTSTLGADMLTNHSDGYKYGAPGCTFNHTAVIGFTTLNISAFETTGTPGILVGDLFTVCSVVIENSGGVGTVTHTIGGVADTVRCITAQASGGHGRLAELQMGFEAVRKGVTEPTVSWAYSGV